MTAQKENLVFFNSKLEAWLGDPAFKGKFVVIHQKEVKGAYDKFAPAIEFAAASFPQGNFVVQQVIRAEDQINFIKAAL